MHWYGFHNTYGNRTTGHYGWIGHVHVFDSRRERDEWVAADRFDGDWHREAITSAEARREMLRDLPDRIDLGGASMAEIMDRYRRLALAYGWSR